MKKIWENGCMGNSKRKSWQDKLNDGRHPQIDVSTKDFAGIKAGQRMLIPTPKLIDEYIRQIPKGKKVDLITLRGDLAREHGAEVTCPLTTGIFLRIVAEAAYEEFANGKPLKSVTPFWRVINEKSSTAKKLSFETSILKEQQQKEKISSTAQ